MLTRRELLIDPINHAIRAAPSTVTIVERRAKSLANPLWMIEQRSNDEFVRCGGNGFGQVLGGPAARSR